MAVNLSSPEARKDRHWFDLDAGPDWAGERLEERIYEIGGEEGTTAEHPELWLPPRRMWS
ncbi:hypothetical protein ACGF3G_49370 [Streptomyces sp. NPDC048179]|uniref:hypothetical protein n=1 Tax=Streptomyces sp. NPDC048179 TaxID=3365506 RepID=UPI00371C2E8B